MEKKKSETTNPFTMRKYYDTPFDDDSSSDKSADDEPLSDSDVEFLKMLGELVHGKVNTKESLTRALQKVTSRVPKGESKRWTSNKKSLVQGPQKICYVTYEILRCPQGFFHVSYSTDKRKMRIEYEWGGHGSTDYDTDDEMVNKKIEEALKKGKSDEKNHNHAAHGSKGDSVCQHCTIVIPDEKDSIQKKMNNLAIADAAINQNVKQKQNIPTTKINGSHSRNILIATKPREDNRRKKQERQKKWLLERKHIRTSTQKLYTEDCTTTFCLNNYVPIPNKEKTKGKKKRKDRRGKKKSYKMIAELSNSKDLALCYNKLELRAEFSESSEEDDTDYETDLCNEISHRYYMVDDNCI